MARKYYLNRDYFLDFQKQKLILSDQLYQKLKKAQVLIFANKYRGYKKVSGTVVADVLEVDNFKSQFNAFCHISGLKGPIMIKKYVEAGVNIEPKVVAALRQKLPQYTIETYDPKKYNYDYFSDQDEIVGGLPDAYLVEKKIIIEIKTTGIKNLQNWNKFGVPAAYIKQAQLYAYLKGVKRFSIVATFLEAEDYLNSANYPIEKRIIRTYPFEVNETIVTNDLLRIKSWYQQYTNSQISPSFDLNKDQDLLAYLRCENSEQYQMLISEWKKLGKADEDFYDS